MKLLILLISSFLLHQSKSDDFTGGSNIFSAEVYQELLADNTGNFLISPFSLDAVLALTQSGAEEETGQEIRTTLHLLGTAEDVGFNIKGILSSLQSDSYNYTLQTANKIYVKEDFSIKEEFTKTATDVYQAGVENVDFLKNVEAAATINQWVEEQTGNKIHDLVKPEDLDENSRLILINALYFQATWQYPFVKDYTKKVDFYISPDQPKPTETIMQYTVKHKYYEDTELDAKFLELPFAGGELTMTFVLPNQKDGLAVLEKRRDKIFLTPPYPKKEHEVYVALPKFKIETSIDFNNILQNMGILKAFNPAEADFSGIAGKKGDLYVEKVKQKSFISVDENGVEAAAATAVDVPVFSTIPNEFVADHPFLFYIRFRELILFEGRVINPTV